MQCVCVKRRGATASLAGWPFLFGEGLLLADTSAWTTVSRAPRTVQQGWAEVILARRVITSPVVRFELLHHARNAREITATDRALNRLVEAPPVAEVIDTATLAIQALAAKGSDGYHRVPLLDLFVASTAAVFGRATGSTIAVVHYDKHFDRLAEVSTSIRVGSLLVARSSRRKRVRAGA